jgi:arylformamidase
LRALDQGQLLAHLILLCYTLSVRTTASSAVWASAANRQLLTHSNQLGTHLDGEIHFFTAGKDIAAVDLNDFLVGAGQGEREQVDRRRLRQRRPPDACTWVQAQVNTIIRDWMPRQAAEADRVFQNMYDTTLAERFMPDKYQLMHIEMFPDHIIHAECLGGNIDLLCNRRATIGFFLWRFVDGESCLGRCVASVDDEEYPGPRPQSNSMESTEGTGQIMGPTSVLSLR